MKRQKISAQDAVNDILQFVYNDEDADDTDDEDDLNDLNGNENEEISNRAWSIFAGHIFYISHDLQIPEEDHGESDEEQNMVVQNNDSDIDEELNPNPRYPKRMLTYQRKVHSIESALDESSYQPINIPEKKPHIIGRQRRADVIKDKPGPVPRARNTCEPVDAFHMFFTKEMFELILENTNRKINNLRASLSEEKLQSFMKITIIDEIQAFVGLMLYRGLFSLNNFSLLKLFSDKYGPPIFAATMSRNRFFFLLRCFCFGDESTRAERWKQDRFAAARELFEMFNEQCMTSMKATDFLSLDETLYPMRSQVAFKQYNPNKPAKYGLLFKSLNSARYPYTYVTTPYSGKPQAGDGEFYRPGTENVTTYLINRLDSNQKLEGKNISFDRLYTTFTLATWILTEKHVTCIGTLIANRRGLPKDIKNVDEREVLSTEFYWDDKNDLILGSPFLSTTIDDGKNKAMLYKLYDFTKGGTDIVDQRMGFDTSKFKSRKWSMVAFAYILDMARVNSSTLFALNNKIDPLKQYSFDFGMSLVFGLVGPFVKQRDPANLKPGIKQKIALTLASMGIPNAVTPTPVNARFPAVGERRRRCKICIEGMEHGVTQDKILSQKSLCQSCGIVNTLYRISDQEKYFLFSCRPNSDVPQPCNIHT
ncbi:uncharacterized protein LOC130622372 [Hydractinia symbiolongicarpus]|uniref:uncharacterized protein LOC130622372 n=1 Tax=Hydractinia symbiolongicarpus TaxID=13093 RepID=UPI00254D5556|nr:uncharacterized protein LOC130622372 [Hydractinia symbiolongicarpus]